MKQHRLEGHVVRMAMTAMCAAVAIGAIARDTPDNRVLKDVFKDYFLIGAALNRGQFFEQDFRSATLVKKHFNTITPENVLKWEVVHPKPDTYDFTASDRFVEFGQKNNMFVVGHTLVWHNQTPKWVFEGEGGKPVDKETLLKRMRDHIQTVVGRYKGRIKGWDVVNEAVVDDGSLKPSAWMKIVGEEYLVRAFQYAHEADPDVELYYNDFSAENAPKRNGVIRLVKMLQENGINVAGIGMQGHYKMDWPSPGQVDSTIREFSALGVKVMITEMDIDVLPQPDWSQSAEVSRRFRYNDLLDPYKSGLPRERQEELANRYAELFRVFVRNHDRMSRVTFWGVEDGNSWLNKFPIAGRTSYPLLFDRDGKPKPAFDAVVKTVL